MMDEFEDCCMCGGDLNTPWDCYANGHSPTSMNTHYNKSQTRKGNKMNYSTAVMLINPNIRAIKTIYEPDTDKAKQQRYIFKTLDKDIKPGDFVVVPTDTRHNMTVVEVVEVDADIDFESNVEIKWIIGRVDTEVISNVLTEEKKWIEALKASEKRKKREEIKKNMLDMYANEDIAALPIASMSGTPAIEHKE